MGGVASKKGSQKECTTTPLSLPELSAGKWWPEHVKASYDFVMGIPRPELSVVIVCCGPNTLLGPVGKMLHRDGTSKNNLLVLAYDIVHVPPGNAEDWKLENEVADLSLVIEYCMTSLSSCSLHICGTGLGAIVVIDLLAKNRIQHGQDLRSLVLIDFPGDYLVKPKFLGLTRKGRHRETICSKPFAESDSAFVGLDAGITCQAASSYIDKLLQEAEGCLTAPALICTAGDDLATAKEGGASFNGHSARLFKGAMETSEHIVSLTSRSMLSPDLVLSWIARYRSAVAVHGELAFHDIEFSDTFHDLHGNSLADSLSQCAGVTPDRVHIASVRPGSVLVRFWVSTDDSSVADRLVAAVDDGSFLDCLARENGAFRNCRVSFTDPPRASPVTHVQQAAQDGGESEVSNIRDNGTQRSTQEQEHGYKEEEDALERRRIRNEQLRLQEDEERRLQAQVDLAAAKLTSMLADQNEEQSVASKNIEKQLRPFGEIVGQFHDDPDKQSYFAALRKLNDRRERGEITDIEFAEAKRRLEKG